MVLLLPKVKSFGEEFAGNIGTGLSGGIVSAIQREEEQKHEKAMRQLQEKAATQRALAVQKLKGEQEAQKEPSEFEKSRTKYYEALTADLEKKGKVKEAENIKENVLPLQNALDVVSQMRNIRKKGNLGLTSLIKQPFSSQARKDVGEYKTLGNSLISFGTVIPIRNRLEFETLTGKLNDPYITDAEAEGVLNGIERIISNSMNQYLPEDIAKPTEKKPEKKTVETKKTKRPLTFFVK